MIIINQDYDQAFVKGEKPLLKVPVYYKDKFFGWNLMFGKEILGFFDTLEEAEEEERKINACDEDAYIVTGFSDYDGGEDFEKILCQLCKSNSK